MKKVFSVILCFIMMLSCIPVSFAQTDGRYIVVSDIAVIYHSPSLTSEKIGEVTKNTVLQVSEIRSTGFGKVTLSWADITGWIPMSCLEALETQAPVTDVSGLLIKSLPAKLEYTDGKEELDLTGLSVYAVKTDGSSYPVTAYNVYAPEMKNPGEKTVKITYSPDGANIFSAEFTVTVIRVPVTGIEIVEMPVAAYKEHALLDLSALTVKTSFSDESMNETLTFNELVSNPDYVISGCHGEAHGSVLEKGTHTFTVMYKYSDITCSFAVEVEPRVITELNIIKQPGTLIVYSNEKIPAIDGLVLEAVYDNGEREEIPHYLCEAVCDPSQFIIGPMNEVQVYYEGLSVTLIFTYFEHPEEQGIKVIRPEVLTFPMGELIDLSGIRVYLYYTDGSYIEVTDYEISEINYSLAGSQDIAVIYKEYSEVFPIVIRKYWRKGDVDGDGEVSSYDARQALRASVGLVELSGMTFFAADADRDDVISASDARLILRASVDLENLYITI